MGIKLVVFDMAGTTVKDKNFVGKAFQQAMQEFGYPIAIEDVNPLMGYEKPVAIRMMLENKEENSALITTSLVNDIHTSFVNNMIQFYETTTEIGPLPNVEETFEVLRNEGIKIGLDTGFSKNIADVIMKRLSWENKVDIMVASDEVPKGRPYPYMIEKIMTATGITNAAQVAKVGDTEVDINEGINSGCRFVVGITTGAFTREELLPYKPTHVIDNITEILDIIGVKSGKAIL